MSWEYLLRYGLTDNLEVRIFSNGLTATKGKNGAVGLSPLAFDFKINFWEENDGGTAAVAMEATYPCPLGSPAFNSGTQPSDRPLFDQTLPLGFNLEQNFGITVPVLGENVGVFSYQWARCSTRS